MHDDQDGLRTNHTSDNLQKPRVRGMNAADSVDDGAFAGYQPQKTTLGWQAGAPRRRFAALPAGQGLVLRGWRGS